MTKFSIHKLDSKYWNVYIDIHVSFSTQSENLYFFFTSEKEQNKAEHIL